MSLTNEQRLQQSMDVINAWVNAAIKIHMLRNQPVRWWIELCEDIAKESDRVLKACEQQEAKP